MKIVIATAVYYPQINGVAVFSHNLARGLAQRGHEVVVIAPSATGRASVKTEEGVRVCRLKSVDVKVYPDQIHKVPAKRKIKGVSVPRVFYKHGLRVAVFPRREVKQILAKFQPDVVHVQVSDPIGLSVVAQARKMGVPVVTTEHNRPEVLTDSLKLPGLLKRGVNKGLSGYFRARHRKSDFVTMPTELAIRELFGGGLAGRSGLLAGRGWSVRWRDASAGRAKWCGTELVRKDGSVIPIAAVSNGVDLKHFHAGKASAEVYWKYKLDETAFTVLYVGRLDPEKEVGVVTKAFLKLKAKVSQVAEAPKMQLVIAGDGVDRAKLEEMAKNEPSVHFLGRVAQDELYEVYRLGEVFVTASPIETQGIVLVEAAASGLPLVAVNRGAVAEVCQDGQNGFLIDISPRENESKKQGREREISAISDALERILLDGELRKKFSKKSLEIAKEHDFERTLDRFENIYRKVVAGQVGF